MTEEQKKELDKCISDPVYFADKYCYTIGKDGKRKKLTYTEAQKHMFTEYLMKGEGSVYLKTRN